jgi:hypothetical protein
MFLPVFSSVAALVSLAALPSINAATFDVTVGGPGILKYDPQFVVRVFPLFPSYSVV